MIRNLISNFARFIQIVNWSTINERTFRPVITQNTLVLQPIRVGQ